MKRNKIRMECVGVLEGGRCGVERSWDRKTGAPAERRLLWEEMVCTKTMHGNSLQHGMMYQYMPGMSLYLTMLLYLSQSLPYFP